ncbi:hypothetical protein EVAR_16513_1 [Eumeta japonica]|uniref:Uncharacterized protein n=1 Tax=Eumeta variegata TaxID=151549 RepID=A0A4C1U2U5_EUMVA|nr:hypothetical protein EVAR_16513_1 [Eumeta japonica]
MAVLLHDQIREGRRSTATAEAMAAGCELVSNLLFVGRQRRARRGGLATGSSCAGFRYTSDPERIRLLLLYS